MSSLYRSIPAVSTLLSHPLLRDAHARVGVAAVTGACRAAIADLRRRIGADDLTEVEVATACAQLPEVIGHNLHGLTQAVYREVINATGVLLHTNLGRAPLPRELPASLTSYLALEYDIERGQRGQRLAPLRDRLVAVCGGEWAVMVNNNAAALLLVLTALASEREVIVSRGQLIEIGGSFRLPEVMSLSGAHLVEVGCTNRTHLRDFERALSDRTGAILIAHPSNFRVVGFTAMPTLEELAVLAHGRDLPLIVDQGTGNLYDLERWGLAHEPAVRELLTAGADVVCFSGDKLLGGPQAGIVVGRRRWVEPLGRHPLYRALRPDKTALVLMDQVLAAHQTGRLSDVPLFERLAEPVPHLRRRALALVRRLRAAGIAAGGCATLATLGGGTTPTENLPSYGLALDGGQDLADRLRLGEPPVVARIEHERVMVDLRTVFPRQDRALGDAILRAAPGSRITTTGPLSPAR